MGYQTTLQNFIANSGKYQQQPFLHQPVDGQWHVFSFTDVEQQARTIAAGLLAQGYQQGDRIGILSKNCAQWFIADLAIMMAGLVSVPIYATAGENTISYVIEHSQMKAIFVGKLDSLDAAMASIPTSVLSISFPYPTVTCSHTWQAWLTDYQPLATIHQPKLNDCMSIIYTSGTTGNPKGAVISHLNLASAAQCTANTNKTTRKDKILSYLPLAHITERSVVESVAYYSGCQIYFVENLASFIDDLRYASPTLFMSVPRLWAKFQAQVLQQIPEKKLNFLLKLPFIGSIIAKKIRTKLGLNSATVFASGSAPISLSLLQWFQKIGVKIGEGWGMTETSGLSCGNFPFNADSLGTIGRPIACVEMKLSEQQEVMIRGDAVFEEYYLNADLTEVAFTDGWFHTGDKGELTIDGAYKIIGRIKEEFKTSKGKYVAPGPIEQMLCRNSDIEQVCVMGLGMKQPIALVVLAEGKDRFDSRIRQDILATLTQVNIEVESHQKLDYIFICAESWTCENELLTPTLKLKRESIEQHYFKLLPEIVEDKIIVQR